MRIRVVSLLAGNADPLYAAMASYLASNTGLDVYWIGDWPWQQRQQALEAGEAELAFVCGAEYVRSHDCPTPPLHVLAAPRMSGARYDHRPVYFSDVVVRADSPASNFADLRGSAWVFNEPQSYSGHDIVRAYLASQGASSGYFATARPSGSHQESLRLVVAGEATASALDSIVLEREVRRDPTLAALIRIVASLGPSPIPPVVCAAHVPPDIRRTLQTAFLAMHLDRNGQPILDGGHMERFVPVTDGAYDPIRANMRRAQDVRLVA